METLFTPEYKVLNDFFGNDISYTIPAYQRPYSWESIGKSDKNNQVNVMWQDLIDYFEEGNLNPYFLGSMVLIGSSSSRSFQVIDGQQRLTTLVLLFVSIKCFLETSKGIVEETNSADLIRTIGEMTSEIDRIIFNKKILGAITQEKKVKIERSIGFDYDTVLKDVMECKSPVLPSDLTEEQTIVTNRYVHNKKYLEDAVSTRFLKNGIFTEASLVEINDFIEFLKNRVAIVRILASQFDVAYQIFEILNNRGLPLSNKDLLRNFLISEFHTIAQQPSHQHIDPIKKWQELENNYDLDNDFISRFVESRNAKNQKYSAFNDLKEIYDKNYTDKLTKKKIEIFYEDIQSYLAIYTKIINTDFDDLEIKNCVAFLLHAGNLTYTLNLLLALFNNFSDLGAVKPFLKSYEKYMTYMLLGPVKRFTVTPIYTSVKSLNQKNLTDALQPFILDAVGLVQLKDALAKPIKDNEIAKLMIARYIWILDFQSSDDVIQQKLDYKNATLEHIIPQTPEKDTNWTNDFREAFRKEYTYRLGNMTLLTQKMNSANKNYDFSEKKKQYTKTKLSITQELIGDTIQLTEKFIEKRHEKIIHTLYTYLEV